MRDEAISAVISGTLLLAVVILAAGATYVVVKGFDTAPKPVFGDLVGRACSTTGRWTVARFGFNSLSDPIRPDEIGARATTGRTTADLTHPIVVSALVNEIRAGNRIWLTTQPSQQADIDCGSPENVVFTHLPTGRIMGQASSGTGVAYLLALSDVDCEQEDETVVTFTIDRVPPGLRRADLDVQDVATGAATNATGDLRLSLSGGSNPYLLPGDELTLSTKKNEASRMGCADTLRFIDAPSAALLREHTLT